MANKEATLLLKVKTAGQEALGKITVTLGDIWNAAGKLKDLLVRPIEEFKEAERANNALTQSMINAGIYTKALKDEYLAQAAALQKTTTFGDDAIIQAQTAVQQQIGQTKVTNELTKSILDFATAQGMDAASAAEAVGKSIGTGTNALARYGVEIDAGASKSEKMAQAIAGLNAKFGGQAEAAAQGLGGLDQLNNVASDLFENLGQRLAPTIGLVAKWFTQLGSDAENSSGALDAMAGIFEFLVRTSTAVVFAFKSLGATIGGVLGTIAGSVEQLINGQFAAAKDSLISGFDEIGQEQVRIREEYNVKIAELDAAANTKKQEDLVAEEEMLRTSHANKLAINQEAAISKQEQDLANQILADEAEIAQIGASDLQKAQLAVQAADQAYKTASTYKDKIKALNDKELAVDNVRKEKEKELEKKKNEEIMAARMTALGQLSNLQNSKNKEMMAMGKAAAIADIGINTQKGAIAAYSAMAGIPYIGPALGIAAAAAISAYGLERAASIGGIQLAEGGIVKARPGGIQATIGEGGQDEAVIPLDKAGGNFGGSTINITVNGGLLGDQTSAYEFAKAVDAALLDLRRNNDSLAFDSRAV